MQTLDRVLEPVDASGRRFAVRRGAEDNLLADMTFSRLRNPRTDLGADLKMLALGVLDRGSFRSGYAITRDPVEMVFTRLLRRGEGVDPALIVRDPRFFTEPLQVGKDSFVDRAFGDSQRVYSAIRRQHNLRTTNGRDQWQRLAMFGDIAASYTYTGKNGTLTANGATSATNSGAAFPTTVSDAVTASNPTVTSATAAFTNMDIGRMVTGTNIPANTFITAVASATSITISNTATGSGSGGSLVISRLQGQLMTSGGRWGVVMSNTATVVTVDQWYDGTSSSGASAALPGNVGYHLHYGGAPAVWVGLCATGGAGNPPVGGHTPAAGDVLRGADGLYAVDGTYTGSAAEQATAGLSRAYISPTFPAAGQIQLSQLFTYTGSVVVTLDVAVLCNSKAAQGSLLLLATQLNASAAVSANGDTVTPTWTVNL